MSQYDSWFNKGHVPAGEDTLHEKAVAEGIVPENCLMGGVPIWRFHEMGVDICQLCNWPRNLCGGRPKRKDGVIETRFDHDLLRPDHSDAGKKQMRLRHWITRIQQQIESRKK